MLEMSEFVLRQDYKIVTTKKKGTSKFEGLCTRMGSQIYHLPEAELKLLPLLPCINDVLSDNGVMISSRAGYKFRIIIGVLPLDEKLTDLDDLTPLATVENPSYCQCLINLDMQLREKMLEVGNPVQASQYRKVNKGEN